MIEVCARCFAGQIEYELEILKGKKDYKARRYAKIAARQFFNPRRFNRAFVEAKIKSNQKDFTGLNLSSLDLSHMDLTRAILRGANLSDCNLRGAVLTIDYQSLVFAELSGTKLDGDQVHEIFFHTARKYKNDIHDLRGVDVSGQDLSDLGLSKVDFSGANMCGADLTGSRCRYTNFSHANLEDVQWEEADLAKATFDEKLSEQILQLSQEQQAPNTGFDPDLFDFILNHADLSQLVEVSNVSISLNRKCSFPNKKKVCQKAEKLFRRAIKKEKCVLINDCFVLKFLGERTALYIGPNTERFNFGYIYECQNTRIYKSYEGHKLIAVMEWIERREAKFEREQLLTFLLQLALDFGFRVKSNLTR